MKKLALLSLLASSLLSGPAFAHIELDAPLVRYSNSGGEVNKHCPCGAGTGSQSTDQVCHGATSDPNRSATRVTTFAAGSTITVTWRETVGHSGRYRIAFDPDGADLADFNSHILADIADPAGAAGAHSLDVTLPNTPCSNCTLQLIQVMNGIPGRCSISNAICPTVGAACAQNGGQCLDAPVTDPTDSPTYFQCADLVLTGPGGEGEGEGAAGEGEGEGAAGEGEGEGAAGEGEGEGTAGEGEGAAAEGEGAAGEGEGAAGEGEGAAAEGEGEGEGASAAGCPGCSSAGHADAVFAGSFLGLLILRRRRR